MVRQYRSLIRLLDDIETGKITITYTDYLQLPATLVKAREIFKEILLEQKSNAIK